MFILEQFMLWWEVLLWEGIRSWREYKGAACNADQDSRGQ